ncbi:MAG: tRNA (guanosine(46)-N7)-methyltransferase TrmB [Candidatus Halalkalibacterium sp. M3_1C_030]
MAKTKLQRFSDIDEFDNVLELTDFQNENETKPKGRWNDDIFRNDNPIILELACGKGDYTVELARRNADSNYVGIDIKGSRLWKGARKAKDEDLSNARFLRIYIDHLDEYFKEGEVDEIWITFPDPYLRGGNRDKRLTSEKFLTIYRKLVKESGPIHLKTDSEDLYNFTKYAVGKNGGKILDEVENVYRDRMNDEILTIKTDFEKKHLQKGKTIRYLKFSLSVSSVS